MIIFLVAIVLLLLFGKGGGGFSFNINNPNVNATPVTSGPGTTPIVQKPVAATPFLKQATGSSLSNALGNSAAVPAYYSSGNPGYTSGLGAPSIAAGTSVPSSATTIVRSGASSPIPRGGPVSPRAPVVPITRGPVNTPQPSPVNPAGTYNPVIANRPVIVNRTSPEVASAPWTRLASTK